MEVNFTSEQEAQLAQAAVRVGTDPEELVKSAALRLLEGDMLIDQPATKIPVGHLGEMKSLRRIDIYEDAR